MLGAPTLVDLLATGAGLDADRDHLWNKRTPDRTVSAMPVELRDLISVSEASALGISGLVQDAEQGRTRVILRHSRPAAAVVSIAKLQRMDELEEDLMLIVTAFARVATDTGGRRSLDEVAAEFGVDLDEPDDSED